MPWMKAPEGCSAIGIEGENFAVGPEGYADIPDHAVHAATAAGFLNADQELNELLAAEEAEAAAKAAAEAAAKAAAEAAAEAEKKPAKK